MLQDKKSSSIPQNISGEIKSNRAARNLPLGQLARLVQEKSGLQIAESKKTIVKISEGKPLFIKCLLKTAKSDAPSETAVMTREIVSKTIEGKGKSNPEKFKRIIKLNLAKKMKAVDKENEVELVNKILFNEGSHIVAVFKEFLIYDDCNEFLHRYYKSKESCARMKQIADYYGAKGAPKPWYQILPEMAILSKGRHRKQKIRRIRDEDDAAKAKNNVLNTIFFKSTFMNSIAKSDLSNSKSHVIKDSLFACPMSEVNLESFLDLISSACSPMNNAQHLGFENMIQTSTAEKTISSQTTETLVPREIQAEQTFSKLREIAQKNSRLKRLSKPEDHYDMLGITTRKVSESEKRYNTAREGGLAKVNVAKVNEIYGNIMSGTKTVRLRRYASTEKLARPPIGSRPQHPQRKLVMPKQQNAVPQIGPPPVKRQPGGSQERLRPGLGRNGKEDGFAEQFSTVEVTRNEKNGRVFNFHEKIADVYTGTKSINKLHLKHAQSTDIKACSTLKQISQGCKIMNARALKQSKKRNGETRGILLQTARKEPIGAAIHIQRSLPANGSRSAKKVNI